MQDNFYPIGVRSWNIQDLTYSDKSSGIIQFDVSGTYSCEYDCQKFPSIDAKLTQIDNSFTVTIKEIINEILVEHQNSNKSFNEFSNYLKSSSMSYKFYSKLNGIVESKGFIHPTVMCLKVNTSTVQNDIEQSSEFSKTVIIDTNNDKEDGQNKCPKCGATDIEINVNNGRLRCNFCRHEFQPEKVVGLETDISQLNGQVIGSGAQDIVADTNEILTLKCSSCGSEVVIDTSEAMQSRCHWCRNTLSINQQIPNGSVPDVVLPFNVKKADAQAEIKKFVEKRKFFAHPKFKEEFTTENIMGVYFPYMVVDVNAHSTLVGKGEHNTRQYTKKQGDQYVTYYDADLYEVEREFDVIIEGLTVESSQDKLKKDASDKTTNIINSIMPFDIENAAKWNANYLKGYTSERRDTNVEQLRTLVYKQSKDIAKIAANDTLQYYDRGVVWSSEQMIVKGQQWKAAYLPVWLYSYQQVKGDKNLLHYVAVNARTKETMGSIPIHMPKLLGVSALVEVLGLLTMLFVDWDYSWLFLLVGFIYFFVMFAKYRNQGARHKHELETKRKISNVRAVDKFVKKKTGLTNSQIQGANNKSISS